MLWKTFEQQHFGLTHRIWGTEFSEKHAMVPCPTLRLYADSTPSQVYDTTKDLSTLPEDFLESMVARILLPVATW